MFTIVGVRGTVLQFIVTESSIAKQINEKTKKKKEREKDTVVF